MTPDISFRLPRPGHALLVCALACAFSFDAQAQAPASSEASVDAATTVVTKVAPQRASRAHRSRRSRRYTAAATPPAVATMPRSAAALNGDLGSILQSRTHSGDWGVLVVSLTRGDTLYSFQPDKQLTPASTEKLFTTALAFDQLGPNWQFSTDVLRDGAVTNGTLNGTLYLRGDGDPTFSNRFLRGDANVPVDLLAQMVVQQGIKHVHGDLVADATAFESRLIPDGWLSRYLSASYAAPVSALSINENVVWVAVAPADAKGPAVVTLEPASNAITINNNVRTIPGSSGASISVRRAGDNLVEARGWIGTRASVRKYGLVLTDPSSFTAGAFQAALQRAGVTIDGQVKLGKTPGSAVKVASLPSPPLERIVAAMDRESINHFAELVFRNAARGPQRTGVGSADSGYAKLERFLTQKVGVAPGAVFTSDGSGLSVRDHVTPRALVQLLAYAHRAPWSSQFHAALPVAGESETLRNRMRFTAADGNLHAKTGTTNDVIALGGYVTAANGELIAFAFLYNGRDRWNAKSTMDAMGVTMASFVRE